MSFKMTLNRACEQNHESAETIERVVVHMAESSKHVQTCLVFWETLSRINLAESSKHVQICLRDGKLCLESTESSKFKHVLETGNFLQSQLNHQNMFMSRVLEKTSLLATYFYVFDKTLLFIFLIALTNISLVVHDMYSSSSLRDRAVITTKRRAVSSTPGKVDFFFLYQRPRSSSKFFFCILDLVSRRLMKENLE